MKPHFFFLWLCSLFLVVSLFSPFVSAFAIAPGKTSFDFHPNTIATGEIILINTEEQPLTLTLEATGELGPFLRLSQTTVSLQPDTSLVVPYTLHLPSGFSRAGSITGMVVAHQQISSSTQGKSNDVHIQAVTGVASVIHVQVPYRGRSLLATVAIPPVDPFMPIAFVAQAQNVGDETLGDVRMDIAIYDFDEHLVTKVSSDEQSLHVKERANFIATWDANVSYGAYHAVITFVYDGREQELQADFIVGRFAIELLDIRVEDFVFGAQATLLAVLQNQEARDVTFTSDITLQDVQAHYTVSLGQQHTTFGPYQDKVLSFPWDLAGVPVGRYEGTISLTADDVTISRRFSITLTETGISASLVPLNTLTGQTISLEPTSDTIAPLRQSWIFFAVFLIAINILVFIVLRIRRRSREQPPGETF